MIRAMTAALLIWLLLASTAHAHEMRPAYLEITQTSGDTFDVLWKVPARGTMRLGLYVQFPETCEPASEPRSYFAGNAYIERWSIRDPGALVGATIRIDGLSRTLTDVLVRIERLDGPTQVARLTPTTDSLLVDVAPGSGRLVSAYLILGVEHILLGVDHLLFVLSLLLLVRGWRRLIETVTAFTIAHSLTLALATLGVIQVPSAPVEAAIALSIVFVAVEVVRRSQGQVGLGERWPWIIALAFGLLHGLGFAGALGEIGLPRDAIPAALLLFNLGVELGQLLFIAGIVALIALLRLIPIRLPSSAARIPPYVIGTVAMFWVIERIAAFPF